jgi:hypothetical protein
MVPVLMLVTVPVVMVTGSLFWVLVVVGVSEVRQGGGQCGADRKRQSAA